MDQLWYYTREGQSLGPISFEELNKLAAAGRLSPSDLVCPVGSQQWQPASSVAQLFPSLPPPPPQGGAIPMLPLDESTAAKSPADDRDRYAYRDRDDRGDRGRQPGPADEIIQVVTRFFSADLHALKRTESEERELNRAKIESPAVRNYVAWRRSVLFLVIVPGFLGALFYLISSFSTEGLSGFGTLLAFLNAVATFAIPVTALIAALNYSRLRMTSRVMLLGALIAYATPLISAIFPLKWLVDDKSVGSGAATLGMKIFLSLTFALIAMLGSLTRGGVRAKSLWPTLIVPGWIGLISAPLLVLAGMGMFLFLVIQSQNVLLIVGIVLWLAAPLLFVWRSDLLIQPLTRSKDLQALAQTRLYALIAAAVGVGFIIIFLFAAKADGSSTIVGFSKSDSAVRAWDPMLHAFWLDYVSRSLFLTVLFADLLLMMNISILKQQKSFGPTEENVEVEKQLDEFDALMARPARQYDEDTARDDDWNRGGRRS